MPAARLNDYLRARRGDMFALGAIALAFLLAFGWAIFRGKFLIGGDVFFYTYPMRTVAWRMIRHGELPLWTPFVLSGFPLLAMVQLGLAYPLTWGHLFLPDHWAEEIYVLAPFLLAPAFTYAYAREAGRSRYAALLAGLAYGYSGVTTNALGMNGIPTNALMWLPLILIALERSRQRLLSPLLGATAAFALSVLTGHAQSFVLVAFVGGAYAIFLVFFPPSTNEVVADKPGAQSFRTWKRWQPLIVYSGAGVLAFGVAAFQIFETLRAARRSIRHSISYDFFSQGSFEPRELVLSFLAPLYHYIDVTAYLAPLVCALAVYVVISAARQRRASDSRIWFWLLLALAGLFLMLGEHTPFYRIVYHVPVFNLFRIPSRHAFEWAFGLSMLGAYGWDALRDAYRQQIKGEANERRRLFVLILITSICLLVGVCWYLSVNRVALFGWLPAATQGRAYLAWKIVFTVGVAVVLWSAHRLLDERRRDAILLMVLVLGCMTEPLILISRWWPGTAKPGTRFTTPGQATQYLQQFLPEQNRVYTHANLGVDENASAPRVDVLDQPALFGIQNAGGYEPFLPERYSRAFGDVDYDAVRPLADHAPNLEVFAPQSHVLDLLNVTHVVAFSDLNKREIGKVIQRDGIDFAADAPALELKPGGSTTIAVDATSGDTLFLVTSMANSVTVEQNVAAARLRISTTSGQIIERELLAGRDTAEWAHERPDVRARIKHGLAPVFDLQPGDASNSFSAQRYWTKLPLNTNTSLQSIEITNPLPSASLAIWKVTLYDSGRRQSTPLRLPLLDATRWRTEKDFSGVSVLRNQRALPRAWLVAGAESVDEAEALRQIRGDSNRPFDPRQIALLEISAHELPPLPGGELADGSTVRITSYQSNSLTIETNSATATVLVLSELFYPGWEATIDGQQARIIRTDYLLRGVALPAGTHRVEMRYRSSAVRTGTIISVLCLIGFITALVYAVRLWGQA